MPGKSKKGGGLEVSPYTMKGHTLPGPFQMKGSPTKFIRKAYAGLARVGKWLAKPR